MGEKTGYVSLGFRSTHPVIQSQERPHEPPTPQSTAEYLQAAYEHVPRPLSSDYRSNDTYPREEVQVTTGGQKPNTRTQLVADRDFDIVGSLLKQSSNAMEGSISSLLNEDIWRNSDRPSNNLHGSEYETTTREVEGPIPEPEFKQHSYEDAIREGPDVIANELKEPSLKLPLVTDNPSVLSSETESPSATGTAHSDSGALIKKTMGSAALTYRPLPLRPQSVFHGWASQIPLLAAGRAIPSLIPLDDKNLPVQWTRDHPINKPIVGKVYYIPDGRNFPTSVIHMQKQQEGFFKHPVLVIGVDQDFAYFYALTKAPPTAIRDMRMCLRMGGTTADEGFYVLRLANSSYPMQTETWTNLEQRFYIEWGNLNQWAVDVRVDTDDLWKLWRRVQELEVDQNRFIYKPLPRDMSLLRPGTVVMLLNDQQSSTLGAPVLIVENMYPLFRYLRIKAVRENPHFDPAARRTAGLPRHMCLEMCKYPKMGHDGTPVMLLESESPEMRESSYVEAYSTSRTGKFEMCKTWCWPPVVIRPQSMAVLREYMANYSAPGRSASLGCHPILHPSSRSLSVGPTLPFRNGGPRTQFGNVTRPPLLSHHVYQISAGTNAYPSPPHTPLGSRPPVHNSQNTSGYRYFGNSHSRGNITYSFPTPDIRQHYPAILIDRYGRPHPHI